MIFLLAKFSELCEEQTLLQVFYLVATKYTRALVCRPK